MIRRISTKYLVCFSYEMLAGGSRIPCMICSIMGHASWSIWSISILNTDPAQDLGTVKIWSISILTQILPKISERLRRLRLRWSLWSTAVDTVCRVWINRDVSVLRGRYECTLGGTQVHIRVSVQCYLDIAINSMTITVGSRLVWLLVWLLTWLSVWLSVWLLVLLLHAACNPSAFDETFQRPYSRGFLTAGSYTGTAVQRYVWSINVCMYRCMYVCIPKCVLPTAPLWPEL